VDPLRPAGDPAASEAPRAGADPLVRGPGRWQEHALESPALQGNPLGDPARRPLFVWTPPAYDAEPRRRFTTLYVLHAMTGQARAFFNVSPFTPNLPALLDRLALEAIIVLVDGFTSLGGAQWIDSPAIGRYGSYLCEDVVGFVDSGFRTLDDPAGRGLAGTSSGGFAAMVWAMLRPDLFGGLASHAGDCLFEVSLAPEFPAAAQSLRNLYGGSFERFWADFRSGRPVLDNRSDPLLQNVYATAAAFSPRTGGAVELPFSLETGELLPEVWQRWRAWDPVSLAAVHAEALRGMRAIWIDAGARDEYHLDLAATAFRAALGAAGVAEGAVHFELFEGGHRGLSKRLPLSLAFLARRLAPPADRRS
jgi:S-formylglutathione hydrolase FrmB